MVFKNYIPVQGQAALLLKESPGIEDNLDGLWTGKDGKPGDNRASQEMRLVSLKDAVTTSGHWCFSQAKQSFAAVRSQAELGNEIFSILDPLCSYRKFFGSTRVPMSRKRITDTMSAL